MLKLKGKKNSSSSKHKHISHSDDDQDYSPRDHTEKIVDDETRQAEKNKLEILMEENRHLKRLLEQNDSSPSPPKPTVSSIDKELLREVENAKKCLRESELKNSHLSAKHAEEIAYLKNEKKEIMKAHEAKTNQFEFLIQQNEKEIDQKSHLISKLEAECYDLKIQIESYLDVPEDEEDYSRQDLQAQISELKQKHLLAHTELQRKNQELDSANKQLIMLSEQITESSINSFEKSLRNEDEESDQKKALEELKKENSDLQESFRKTTLDSIEKSHQISTLLDKVSILNAQIQKHQESHREFEQSQSDEKDTIIWDLKKRLLDKTQLQGELEETIKNQNSNKSSYKPTKMNDLEKSVFELRGELYKKSEELQNKSLVINELRLEVQRIESENQSLKKSNSHKNRSLPINKNLISIPIEGEGDKDHLKIELQIKNAALQKLSLKNEELNEQLAAFTRTSTSHDEEIMSEEISILHQRLTILNEKITNLSKEKEALLTELNFLQHQNMNQQKELDTLRESYKASQKHFGQISQRNKAENNAYAEMIGSAFADMDRFQKELSSPNYILPSEKPKKADFYIKPNNSPSYVLYADQSKNSHFQRQSQHSSQTDSQSIHKFTKNEHFNNSSLKIQSLNDPRTAKPPKLPIDPQSIQSYLKNMSASIPIELQHYNPKPNSKLRYSENTQINFMPPVIKSGTTTTQSGIYQPEELSRNFQQGASASHNHLNS